MRFLTPILKLLGSASLAVLARMFAQPVVEKLLARVVFKALHAIAAKTSNDLDDELVQITEDQYYGRTPKPDQ